MKGDGRRKKEGKRFRKKGAGRQEYKKRWKVKMKTELIEKREVEDGKWKAKRRKGRKGDGNI
jgi:hypothetical protein